METVIFILSLTTAACAYSLLALRREISRIGNLISSIINTNNSESPITNVISNNSLAHHSQIFYENLSRDISQASKSTQVQANAISELVDTVVPLLSSERHEAQMRDLFACLVNISEKMTSISESQQRIALALQKSNSDSKFSQDSLREIAHFTKFPPRRRVR